MLFKAGPGAFQDIRKRGFAAERIGTIAGASGGPKWLVLSQLDRVIVERLLPKLAGPVHLAGSSIGAWRFACYAQAAPLDALIRFEEAYLEQSYSAKPTAAEITQKSRAILGAVLDQGGAQEILSHPHLRLHVLAVRCGRLTSSESRPVLAAGMFAAACANLASRRALGVFFKRGLFYDPRDLPPFYNATGFPLERVRLTVNNLPDAIVASGSIPMVLTGVRDIHGAPPGIYRDGGVIDYHLDLPLSDPDRLTLYPHFFEQLVPGWFDKRLRWRRLNPLHTERTILLCPSPGFVARLPGGRIPDRTDFARMPHAQRVRTWRSIIAACAELADDLVDVLEKDLLAERLQLL
ncbi:MAG TPA: hypothetical protein VMP00_13445 [Burkholderiales bacterium]|nr:hypothetical protein [Burkholderiales bacterium]